MGSLLGVLMLIGFRLDTSVAYASEFTKDDLKTLAVGIAVAHNLDVERFLATVDCESKFNPKAKGDYRNGKPTSFGIVQLRFPERDWGITIEQAYEPLRSMEIMALAWERGLERKWTCARSFFSETNQPAPVGDSKNTPPYLL